MLKEGHKHLSGLEEAVLKNIEACKQLAQITRTSMGPNGEGATSRWMSARSGRDGGGGGCVAACGARPGGRTEPCGAPPAPWPAAQA